MSATQYTGLQFGRLILLNKVRSGGKGVGQIWLARCSCGNTREVVARRVVHGEITSCGKCTIPRGRQEPTRVSAPIRRLYLRYARRAAEKSITWELSIGEFATIISSNCTYCGIRPSTGMRRGQGIQYTGIDRVSSTEGYIGRNAISCCTNCRRLKQDYTTEEFISYVLRIAHHITKSTPTYK